MAETLTELLDRIVAAQAWQVERGRVANRAARKFLAAWDDRDMEWECSECFAVDRAQDEAEWRVESARAAAHEDAAVTLETIAQSLASSLGVDVPEMAGSVERILGRAHN